MRNIKPLLEIVENSSLVKMQKLVIKSFIENASNDEEDRHRDRQLVENIGNVKNLDEILLSNEDVIIYTVRAKGKDDWDTKYPYRSIFRNNKGLWERCSTVSPSFDLAFIVYLEYKYLGGNSRFTDFAVKMLEIKLED